VAWLSLDGGDRDPARFWRYVAAALDQLRPGVGQQVDALFQGGQPPLEAVLTVLVNQLVEGPEGGVVLVLDDYHLVEEPPVHDGLAVLLARLPPQLRLVLASRADPPLPLARLRAGGQLAELREADLRFTPEETAALLRTAVGPELSEAAVAALDDRTEGWAAGLQLAMARRRPDVCRATQRLVGRRTDPGVLPALLEQTEHALGSPPPAGGGGCALDRAGAGSPAALPTRLDPGDGRELSVSVTTYWSQVQTIYRKLQPTSRAEAVTHASQLRLLPPAATCNHQPDTAPTHHRPRSPCAQRSGQPASARSSRTIVAKPSTTITVATM
jgi:ATP/maltotriose-dependent transcriptional regulator MalT